MTFSFGAPLPGSNQSALNAPLNPQQDAVVHSPIDSVIVVMAGAGCGKTSGCILPRSEWLLKEMPGTKALIQAYNKKIQVELKEKIGTKLDPAISRGVDAMTSHAVAKRLLDRYSHLVGLTKQWQTLDADWKKIKFLKDCHKEEYNSRTPTKLWRKEYGSLEDKQILAMIGAAEKAEAMEFKLWEVLKYFKPIAGLDSEFVAAYISWAYERRHTLGQLFFSDWLPLANRLPDKCFADLGFDHILVDEAQDLNKDQHRLVQRLNKTAKSLLFVGDAAQCFVPGTIVDTSHGPLVIEKVRAGDQIVAASGRGQTCLKTVQKTHSRLVSEELVTIKTDSGRVIRCTKEHSLFTQLVPDADQHFVYLMYREDKGYRIGVTRGYRTSGAAHVRHGLDARARQEQADAAWILKACATKAEALVWEQIYSVQYGIPELCFKVDGFAELSEEDVDLVFATLPTRASAVKLAIDLSIDLSQPHWAVSYGDRAVTVTYVSYDRGHKNGFRSHAIAWETADEELARKAEAAGLPIRPAKAFLSGKPRWRVSTCKARYEDARALAFAISEATGVEVVERFAFTEGKSWSMTSAGQVHPGMLLPVWEDEKLLSERVVSVSWDHYEGPVYDLDVEDLHNYTANGVVVHNCIYRFAGSRPDVFMAIDQLYPNTVTHLMETNYRSVQPVLDLANWVLKNYIDTPVTLKTPEEYNGATVKISFLQDVFTQQIRQVGGPETPPNFPPVRNDDDLLDMSEDELASEWGVEIDKPINWVKTQIAKGVPLKDIAILYRVNADAIDLELDLLGAGIPYRCSSGTSFSHPVIEDIMTYVRFLRPQANRSEADWGRIVQHRKYLGKLTAGESWEDSHYNPLALQQPPSACRTSNQKTLFRTMQSFCRKIQIQLEHNVQAAVKEIIEYLMTNVWSERWAAEPEDMRDAETISATFTLWSGQLCENATDLVNLIDRIREWVENNPEDSVSLSTVHKAKGLEWPHVLLYRVGTRMPLEHPFADLAEEACIFYVALTRAMLTLTIIADVMPNRLPFRLFEHLCPMGYITIAPGTYSECDRCPNQLACAAKQPVK